MEALTRLVSESLARYGLDRPVDYRRLQWSRWFRCESLHSLLHVPSKPGIFAIAEEIMEFGPGDTHVETAALGCLAEGQCLNDAEGLESREGHTVSLAASNGAREGHDFSRAINAPTASAAEAQRRMLSVLQFHEDDDMAYVLDRMLSRQNPMSARLASGKCFVRFVVIEDETQRRSICNALNQWMVSTGEKVSGIGAHFAISQEFGVGRTLFSATANATKQPAEAQPSEVKSHSYPDSFVAKTSSLNSGFATNIHCPQPLPSGF
jgi:hypothetical protein